MDYINNLIKSLTANVTPDNRVFGRDVLSKDTFSKPFDLFIDDFVNNTMRPEFNRYSFNPFMKQANRQLFDANQDMGLSGGYRVTGGAQDISDAANDLQLQKEQLNRGFSDQALSVKDALYGGWVDPLYQSRMENFYNSPLRENGGVLAQAPAVQAPVPAVAQSVANGYALPAQSDGQQVGGDKISSYMKKSRIPGLSSVSSMIDNMYTNKPIARKAAGRAYSSSSEGNSNNFYSIY